MESYMVNKDNFASRPYRDWVVFFPHYRSEHWFMSCRWDWHFLLRNGIAGKNKRPSKLTQFLCLFPTIFGLFTR